jgi:glycosyltransferase involved in cell wall biosynthesis
MNDDLKRLKVAILMITYNHEAFIAQAIEGVLMQKTNFNFKLIITDDCSTDKTTIICKQYAEKYPELIDYELLKSNMGAIKNASYCLKKCINSESTYIAICEGDDYWTDPIKLQKQVDFLGTNLEYVGCYHGCKHINEKDEVIKISRYKTYDDQPAEKMLTAQGAMITHTVMFRNLIKGYPSIFEGITSGDTILYHLLGFHGDGKFLSDIEYSAYRIHSGGIWSGIDDLQRMKNTLSTMSSIKENLVLHFGKETDYVKKMHFSAFNNIKGFLYLSLYHKSFRMYFSMLKLIFTQKSFSKTFFLKQHLIDLFQKLFKIK